MRRINYFLFLFLFLSLVARAQKPSIIWERSYGGTKTDGVNAIDTTADGNIVLAIGTVSSNFDINCRTDTTQSDCWIVCINQNDSILWQHCYGGSQTDGPLDIQLTNDHGFIIVGATFSNDGDISGNHGGRDIWVLKIDSAGKKEWSKCYGGTGSESGQSIRQTSEGGYILCGYTYSNNGDVPFHYGSQLNPDYWVIKIDSAGIIQWQKVLGGTGYDASYDIIELMHKNYLVTGNSNSTNEDVSFFLGGSDVWNVLLDSTGEKIWDKSYGGTGGEDGIDLLQCHDGSIICLARTGSIDGQVTQSHGGSEYWVIKIDLNGSLLWQKALGGEASEQPYKIIQTSDSGFIVIGDSYGYTFAPLPSGQVSNNYGSYDIWLAKIDKNGEFQWEKNIGSSLGDRCKTGIFYNGKLYIAGNSEGADHDVSKHYGSQFDIDGWVIKLDISTGIEEVKRSPDNDLFIIKPNPASDEVIVTNYSSLAKEIEIKDLLGRRVLAQPVSPSSLQTKIDIGNLITGIYFVTVKGNNGSMGVKKFVKG